MTILCVTPNPAVDHTLIVPGFSAGSIYYANEDTAAAGGKGVNVARVIQVIGQDTLCAGFVGGYSGQRFCHLAKKDGLRGVWTPVEGETRTCSHIVNPITRQTTVVNGTGPRTTGADWKRFRDDVLSASTDCDTICVCGTLPSGTPMSSYIALLRSLVDLGRPVWVDASGDALRAALSVEGIHIKINDIEAGLITERPVVDVLSAQGAARVIQNRTRNTVAVTMGQRGAVMLNKSDAYFAEAPSVSVVGTVGSGDAFLAGLIVGFRESAEAGLRQAVAAGSANVTTDRAASVPLEAYKQLQQVVSVTTLN